jgi:hypothetical protein
MRAVTARRARLGFGFGGALWLLAACASSSNDGGESSVGRGTDDGSPPPEGGKDPSVRPGQGSTDDDQMRADAGAPPRTTPDDDECNELSIHFESRTPTVYILVDRSSSMFEKSFWVPLKNSVLEVVQKLEKEALFGFATYTGAAGGMCPDLSRVSVASDNFAAIKAAYDAATMPTYKGETPTSLALDEVTKILEAEPNDGPKFILLVTDGEPDFCDDPNVTCSRDAVVSSAQAAFAEGIKTFIFSIGGMVDKLHLGDVANAGSGQPVADRQMMVQYQCPNSKAVYSPTSGTAPYYEPNINDQQALVSAFSKVVASARSCTFDLEGKVEIRLSEAASGIVKIDGKQLVFDDPNGFRMNSPTELEVLGTACEQLRSPDSLEVFIDFPCEAVVVF